MHTYIYEYTIIMKPISLSLYVCVYVCMYMYTCVYICIYIYIYIYARMHKDIFYRRRKTMLLPYRIHSINTREPLVLHLCQWGDTRGVEFPRLCGWMDAWQTHPRKQRCRNTRSRTPSLPSCHPAVLPSCCPSSLRQSETACHNCTIPAQNHTC